MYEEQAGTSHLTGLIVIETDDLLGGGIGAKWTNAIAQLRNTFKFGSWTWLQEGPTQYGGRTLQQRKYFGFHIDMNRYLRTKAHEIKNLK